MATKTISIEIDACELLVRERIVRMQVIQGERHVRERWTFDE